MSYNIRGEDGKFKKSSEKDEILYEPVAEAEWLDLSIREIYNRMWKNSVFSVRGKTRCNRERIVMEIIRIKS